MRHRRDISKGRLDSSDELMCAGYTEESKIDGLYSTLYQMEDSNSMLLHTHSLSNRTEKVSSNSLRVGLDCGGEEQCAWKRHTRAPITKASRTGLMARQRHRQSRRREHMLPPSAPQFPNMACLYIPPLFGSPAQHANPPSNMAVTRF